MKRTIPYLLALLLLISALAGVGSAFAAEQAAEAFSAEGSVIFEQEGVKITTAGLDTDPTSFEADPIIWLDIENSGEGEAYLGVTNGVVNGFMADVYLIDFYVEDGEYFGGDYTFTLTVPVGGGRYALGYYGQDALGVNLGSLGVLELCFTLAEDEFSWPDYTSESVTIAAGEAAEAADIADFGTVVIDDDILTLVIGELDYDDWLGPMIPVYIENKTESFLGVQAQTAEADGNVCDLIFYSSEAAPGKYSADLMSFDSPICDMRGIEDLTIGFMLYEGDSMDDLYQGDAAALEPVNVQYAPQVWGDYENGGLALEIQPRYNDLVTVETPESDEDGILFSVSETASMEAGDFEGVGWLFSIGTVDEERLHELLCWDMSGMNVFAKDEEGSYYIYYHPTDVRFARATVEEMEQDEDQWTMLNEWAMSVPDQFAMKNGLEYVSFGNTEIDMYVARAAWMEGAKFVISTTEYGPVIENGADGTPYAEFIMGGWFWETDPDETPDGEYVEMSFPDDDVRFDFFFAPGGYVRAVHGDYETLYQAAWYDEDISFADAVQGWYYAAAEWAGIKAPGSTLDLFEGMWAEHTAGRGVVTIEKTIAPGKAKIEASWPDSAAVAYTWEMTAELDEEGRLIYENGVRTVTEYDESGEGWITDESWGESGWFYLNSEGELCWHDNSAELDEDSVFDPC